MHDQVVLVTGAARGIGAQTARVLSHRGAKLVLSDKDEAPLLALVDELGADSALGQVADVSDLPSMEDIVAAGVTRFGGLDAVLANAGIGSYGSVLNVDPAAFQRVIDVNVMGVFNTVRAALPSVIERKGYLLLVSSLGAFAPMPGQAGYNASKAAVEQFANTLRVEVAHHGVAVGSAHPGWIDTPLVRDLRSDVSAFETYLSKMPYPLRTTASVESCAHAMVAGLEQRRRRVYTPTWVRAVALLRHALATDVGERTMRPHVQSYLEQMDAATITLGRSMSARSTQESLR